MDTYLNMRAFIATADTGSFSGAAREQGISISVLTKRVNQLEHQLRTPLFHRSTRSLTLTEEGRVQVLKCRSIVSQVEEMIASPQSKDELIDFIRVRAPITLARLVIGPLLQKFMVAHPKIRLELVITERQLIPEDSSFDISLGAKPITVGDVSDFPLSPLKRTLCASPSYLDLHGSPGHPRDLAKHECLCYLPTGTVWTFNTEKAPIHIEILPQLSSNDGQLISDAAVAGMGVTILSNYILAPMLASEQLVPLLTNFPLPQLWLTATVPSNKAKPPAVEQLLKFLKSETLKIFPS